ncbi:hypothetical protein [Aliamphritea ceti]|uniref:hypothetical protein n=1 Tax=Aliamphritea ceti TaxID=1524258 RepID=UPI0021C3774C|nr:hypothetical protein [Aliamphritea ceti]
MTPLKIKASLLVALLGCSVVQVAADPVPQLQHYSTQAVIQDMALEGSSGVIGVNIVAGDSNAQLNARALAFSVGQGIASASIHAAQRVELLGDAPDSAVSLIQGSAFSNASGMISVNHASGVSNAQVNDIAIGFAIGGVAVTESELSLTVTGQPGGQPNQDQIQQHREASISGSAFEGASGVVQINQLAGSGNATSNSFGLTVSVGAEQ